MPPWLSRLESLRDGNQVLHFENRYQCKNGSVKWLEWAAIPQVDEQRIYAVARDVTDRRQSLDELLGDDSEWKRKFATTERRHVGALGYRRGPSGAARFLYREKGRPALKGLYRRLRPAGRK